MFEVDRIAVRLIVAGIIYLLVVSGVDPHLAEQYRTTMETAVTGFLTAAYAVYIITHSLITHYHNTKNGVTIIEKPNLLDKIFSKIIVSPQKETMVSTANAEVPQQ